MDRRAFLKASGLGVAATLRVAPLSAGETCVPTAPNPEGPFYLAGAPFSPQLAHPEEPGRPLSVTGRVLSGAVAGCVAVPGAVVDVWHASDRGVYYGLEGGGRPEPLSLRGRVRADRQGEYAFHTVLPGHYPLSRSRVRPRHVHYRVTAPGHRTLITQLYFAGDPALATDPLAVPALVRELEERDGALHCRFDLVLAAP